MAISRMQEPRQLYGLGSLVRKITRPIKKAVKGVSKIAKSPIGKAAILAGLGAYAGGLGPFAKGARFGNVGGAGFLRNMFAAQSVPGVPDFVTGGKPSFFSTLNPFGKNFSMKNLGITAGAAGFLLPFVAPKLLAPKEEDVEAIDYTVQPAGIAAIVNQAKDYYRTGGGGNLDFMARKEYVLPNFYAAEGGIADLKPRTNFQGGGMDASQDDFKSPSSSPSRVGGGSDASQDDFTPPSGGGGDDDGGNKVPTLIKNTIDTGGDMLYLKNIMDLNPVGILKSIGGRMIYDKLFGEVPVDEDNTLLGGGANPPRTLLTEVTDIDLKRAKEPMFKMMDYDTYKSVNPSSKITPYEFDELKKGNITQTGTFTAADGGRAGAEGGGLMNLNGLEMDFRANGGFVPIGAREKADDVPARLSKNEFVMTADAVRGAGGGSIERGAQKMYNTMKELESRVV